MTFDLNIIKKYYQDLQTKLDEVRNFIDKPLTLTEKILYSHLWNDIVKYESGLDYVDFKVDRVAMQDATAQMALLQFMIAGKNDTAVPTTVHADHLIQAKIDASNDLDNALDENSEVYSFLSEIKCYNDDLRWF